jgi:S1-C subfamily serine protease
MYVQQNPRAVARSRAFRGAAAAISVGILVLGIGSPGVADESSEPTPTPTEESTPQQEVVPLVQPSIVYQETKFEAWVWSDYNNEFIDADDPTFHITTQCTGFVVNPDGWIATAGHCLDKVDGKEDLMDFAVEWALDNYYTKDTTAADAASDLSLVTFDQNDNPKLNTVTRSVTVSFASSVNGEQLEKTLPARVIDTTKYEQGDAALLKVEGDNLNALPLSESDVEISTDVVAVGYPAVIENFTDRDLTPTFNPGNVSSTKTLGGGLVNVYQLSAGLSGGMSGGPTVNLDGEVIGVNTARFNGEPISYAMPVDRVQELMASQGVENTLSETTATYREGIDAYNAGDKDAAVSALEAVVQEQPGNQLAADYLAKARELPDPPPESDSDEGSGSALPWILGGAGALVLLLGIVLASVAAARRRARRRATEAARLIPGYPGYPGGPPPAPAQFPMPQGTPGGQWQPPAPPPGSGPLGFTTTQQAPPGAFCSNCGSPRNAGRPTCACRIG